MSGVDGKVVLVTGGARGMGASHAGHLTALGARVVIGDVRDAAGEAVAAGLGPACRYVHHDVTSEADWAAAVEATLAAFGQLVGWPASWSASDSCGRSRRSCRLTSS